MATECTTLSSSSEYRKSLYQDDNKSLYQDDNKGLYQEGLYQNDNKGIYQEGLYQEGLYQSKSKTGGVDFCDSAVKLLIPDTLEPALQPASSGLTLQELKQYAQDPFWVRVRTACFVSLWLGFVSLLTAVIVLTVQAPRCRGLDWWQQGVAYHVLVPSYRDAQGAGVGGLTGVESKLDYIASLGVKLVWLSPVFPSPMMDSGYDVQDYVNVDPRFGSLDDLKQLVRAMKHRGLKLMLDYVPNHTSDQHEWFIKSQERVEPYDEFYIWRAAAGHVAGSPVPPNNWLSVFGGSAWQWSEARQQFYLHQFAKEQPDLNFRNRAVVDEMLAVLRFWLDLGVDGFRVDSIAHLFEAASLADEPLSNKTGSTPGQYDYLRHVHTHNQPEVFAVLAEFREVLAEHARNTDNVNRLLTVEVYETVEENAKYYGTEEAPLADFPFNFVFVSQLNRNSTAKDVKTAVDSYMSHLPRNKWPNWVLGNHDHKRVATRFGPDMVDAMNMHLLLLPGTAVTYYGEEIGMEDTTLSWQDTVDPAGRNAGEDNYARFSRDPARTPMQWNDEKNAGFSNADTTWLPVNPNYKTLNVELQKSQSQSHLNVYKSLVRLRSEPSLMYGQLQTLVLQDSVFAFTRTLPGSLGYAVAVNWGNTTTLADLTAFSSVPDKAQVHTTSINFKAGDMKYVDTRQVSLAPKEGIVLMFTPNPEITEAAIGL